MSSDNNKDSNVVPLVVVSDQKLDASIDSRIGLHVQYLKNEIRSSISILSTEIRNDVKDSFDDLHEKIEAFSTSISQMKAAQAVLQERFEHHTEALVDLKENVDSLHEESEREMQRNVVELKNQLAEKEKQRRERISFVVKTIVTFALGIATALIVNGYLK